jgi:hypothetical protein
MNKEYSTEKQTSNAKYGYYEDTTHIDHVVIYAKNALDDVVAQYKRLGFNATPRGHHSMGSSNHLIIFDTDYIELLGVEPHNVTKFGNGWNHPTGLSGLVFKTVNAVALWKRLSASGVPLEGNEPDTFFRPVDLHDNQVHNAYFRIVRLALDSIPNGRVFFCEQQTPELVWRSEWQQHPNGANGILEYVYITEEPTALAALLDSAVGPGLVTHIQHGLRIQLGRTAVLFLSPEAIAARYGANAIELPPNDTRAIALTLSTHSLQSTHDALSRGKIKDVRTIGDRIIVPTPQAGGTILSFAQEG